MLGVGFQVVLTELLKQAGLFLLVQVIAPFYHLGFPLGSVPIDAVPARTGGGKSDWAFWERNRVFPATLMNWPTMERLIRKLGAEKIALLWTGGGEPTYNPYFLKGMTLARRLELYQGLYTNGSLLTEAKIERLFDLELSFIRISLNCGYSESHAQFHGCHPGKSYFSKVMRNIELCAQGKEKRKSPVTFGVAVIFDETNVRDLLKPFTVGT